MINGDVVYMIKIHLEKFVSPVKDSEWSIIWSLKWSTMGIVPDENMCGRL